MVDLTPTEIAEAQRLVGLCSEYTDYCEALPASDTAKLARYARHLEAQASRAEPNESSREIVTRLHQAAESIKAYGHVATADTLLEIAATFRSLLVTAQDALPYPERLVELDGGAVRKPYEGGLLRLRDALNRCTAGPLQQRGNSPLCYYGSTNCEDAIAQALDTAKRRALEEAANIVFNDTAIKISDARRLRGAIRALAAAPNSLAPDEKE